ncbi:hypothetical protein P692DRAFT_20929934 [Suillus brevipes Sb2]|nr:hypothetical protein P692DRAFT_20929934 [Suillus brevipes Sb2]
MEFKSGMDVVVQVFYTCVSPACVRLPPLHRNHSFNTWLCRLSAHRTVCPRPSPAITMPILQPHKPAPLCQSGTVAFPWPTFT